VLLPIPVINVRDSNATRTGRPAEKAAATSFPASVSQA